MGVIRLHFLTGSLNSTAVCLGEEPRTNTINTHVERRLNYVFKI